jgi:predicted SAM-dependent methyltransferase
MKDYLATHKIHKLHLGEGSNIIEGWLNTEVEPKGNGVYLLDASKPFPFHDCTFDYVFSEHLIEHFSVSFGDGGNPSPFRRGGV